MSTYQTEHLIPDLNEMETKSFFEKNPSCAYNHLSKLDAHTIKIIFLYMISTFIYHDH